MKRDKTLLKEALKKAQASEWQQRAAFILLKINGIENALKYTKQVGRRNKNETSRA